MEAIRGIHHITAMCGEAQRNVNFYVHALGQRLVKKTVNFDDPGTYHLYYGDAEGTPGTIMTFFPWPRAQPGTRGVGETAAFAYAAPSSAQTYWEARLESCGARQAEPETRFGEVVLPFQDPDGVWVEIVLHEETDRRTPAQAGVTDKETLEGFHSATLWVAESEPTVHFLETVFGWEARGVEGKRTRLQAPGDAGPGCVLDVVAAPGAGRGRLGPGSIHHIAFRVANDEQQLEWRGRLADAGISVTEVRDRQYFRSIYFREPGGVLFEIATDTPGFDVDEASDALGRGLKLPLWLEPRRAEIEARLPALTD